ncbi:MAG TPA: hypothetical protein VN851_12330, partial [Thermoanaerobaculia bacterium]|nr:hypothetical protein [Thermoanaerobaculia bacterium]
SYLYGDPGPANALIKKDNPEMTDDLLVYGRQAMKRHGVVDSGAAKTLGIGAMTDARWKRFAAGMIKAGVYPAGLDLSRAYTLRFVNRGVGMKRPSPAAPLPKGKVPASQLSPPAPLPKGEGRTAETPLFLLPSPLGRGAGGEGC